MKPETKAWLDKLVPLIVHLKEGGKVRYKYNDVLFSWPQVPYLISEPDLYTIHKEPRVVYLTAHEGELRFPPRAEPATDNKCEKCTVHRFIEDLNWKPDQPDLDADHHLGEPSKQASDYMKTI